MSLFNTIFGGSNIGGQASQFAASTFGNRDDEEEKRRREQLERLQAQAQAPVDGLQAAMALRGQVSPQQPQQQPQPRFTPEPFKRPKLSFSDILGTVGAGLRDVHGRGNQAAFRNGLANRNATAEQQHTAQQKQLRLNGLMNDANLTPMQRIGLATNGEAFGQSIATNNTNVFKQDGNNVGLFNNGQFTRYNLGVSNQSANTAFSNNTARLTEQRLAAAIPEQKLVEIYDEKTGRKTKGYIDPITKEFSPVGGVAAPSKSLVTVNTGDAAGRGANILTPEEKSLYGFEEDSVVAFDKSGVPKVVKPPQTPGQAALDKAFSADYSKWVRGGGSDARKAQLQLQKTIEMLKARINGGKRNLTGTSVGFTPKFLRPLFNAKGVEAEENVAEVTQRNLKAILGGQFGEKEGDRLIARAFNPALSEEVNLERVTRLAAQMESAVGQKQAMADYFEENGTLNGFKGHVPTFADFEDAVAAKQGQDDTPANDVPDDDLTPEEQAELQRLLDEEEALNRGR